MAAGESAPKQGRPAPDLSALERVQVELLAPPQVHAHEARATGKPKVVEFRMVIEEKTLILDDQGTEVHAMTFNGSVPGPLMVVHQDDYVELTLVNPATNSMPHNIDFHAATGALGGGALTIVSPGEQVRLRFRATRPGVFVYHCAPGGAMIPWHVVSGMNGAIMVLPRDGLKDRAGKPLGYDKVVYIGEQDFYVPRDKDGKFKRYASPAAGFADMQQVMRGLIPSHIVFNGNVGALTGKNALTAKVGETVLIVHSQANRDTRPHLIGGHGDHVWASGKFSNPPEQDLETWFIPGGAAGAALYTFRQPGLYAYLNHNLIEGVLLGATAHFQVEGEWDSDLMSQVEPPSPIR
ncbi:copper-containing nitrite reductase [Pseudomonas sp. PDNC002]|uniref:copper-containing nitrite reductase n=1 Tax=Pseudomonas sp. PDNC002 TaxID=2811422 RepID=UPI001F071199|nr:copper-containing nitrite reductase [Pseudomonas sp. PDNC002]